MSNAAFDFLCFLHGWPTVQNRNHMLHFCRHRGFACRRWWWHNSWTTIVLSLAPIESHVPLEGNNTIPPKNKLQTPKRQAATTSLWWVEFLQSAPHFTQSFHFLFVSQIQDYHCFPLFSMVFPIVFASQESCLSDRHSPEYWSSSEWPRRISKGGIFSRGLGATPQLAKAAHAFIGSTWLKHFSTLFVLFWFGLVCFFVLFVWFMFCLFGEFVAGCWSLRWRGKDGGFIEKMK